VFYSIRLGGPDFKNDKKQSIFIQTLLKKIASTISLL